MDVDCGSARDRLGRTLGGKYRLDSVLGAGGTAVVYRASQRDDGENVAVKVLHDHLSRSEEVCRRFVREGQLGNVLDHPNTVRVVDHGSTEEGCPYLVLEYLEGESLEDRRVRAGGRIGVYEALDYADQLLSVLEVAHAKSIVHRDIKPSNLFVLPNGQLKVLDFGIARLVDDTSATSTKTGQMVGTPAFMPPEQALSRPRDVDARTDLWAVGATLFTLLSGEHVHIAESSSEHLVKAATLHARSLARALPGVPRNVEALVARALAFDKNERWSSAQSMRTEVLHVRADPGAGIGTSTSPPPERTPSDPNLPTLIGSSRVHESAGSLSAPGTAPGMTREEVSGELDANMALTSMNDELRPRQRRWLVPFAIVASVLLVLMSGLVVMLSIQKPAPAATAASVAPVLTPPSPPVAAVPVPTPAVEPDPAPPSSASGAPRTPPPVVTAAKAAPAAPKKPPSRKDVYRPF